MKQILVLAIFIASILFSSCGGGNKQSKESTSKSVEIKIEKESYKPAEKEALTILKAYADKDLETLKSYASGSTKMGLDEAYFSEGNGADFKEKINEHWTGAFNDIRYYNDEVNFQKYYYAIAVFYESPSGQLTGVSLKSTDKENWKMAGFGTKHIKKEEFEQYSQSLPE